MLFQLMMGAALTAQIAFASRPALVERHRMVQVALLGWPTARAEPTGSVSRDDQVGDPGRWPVGSRGQPVAAAV